MTTRTRIDADTIRARTDLVALAGEYTELHQRGREWWGCCPLHAEREPSFSVNPEKAAWFCHGCGQGGDCFALVMAVEHLDFREAVARLSGGDREHAPAPRPIRAISPSPSPPSDWRRHLSGLVPLDGTPGADYLVGRGLDVELATAAGLQYHPDWYGLGAAVVYPITGMDGVQVAAEGRYLDPGDGPRQRTAGPKSGGAFITPGALTHAPISIVEGMADALTLHLCGCPAVATCSATNHPTWLPTACARVSGVVIGYDPDGGGERGVTALMSELRRAGVHSRWVRPPTPGQDWNDALRQYGQEALTQALASAGMVGGALPPPFKPGDKVSDLWGKWLGTVTAYHWPDTDCPGGWIELQTDDGRRGQSDALFVRMEGGIE